MHYFLCLMLKINMEKYRTGLLIMGFSILPVRLDCQSIGETSRTSTDPRQRTLAIRYPAGN